MWDRDQAVLHYSKKILKCAFIAQIEDVMPHTSTAYVKTEFINFRRADLIAPRVTITFTNP